VPAPRGTRHPRFAPHGNYPCSGGGDQSVALWVGNDHEWASLVECCGTNGLLGGLKETASFAARLADAAAIDAALTEWTSRRSRHGFRALLNNVGVRAAPVRTPAEADAEWLATRPATEVDHPVTGRERVFTIPWRFSVDPPRTVRAAPM